MLRRVLLSMRWHAGSAKERLPTNARLCACSPPDHGSPGRAPPSVRFLAWHPASQRARLLSLNARDIARHHPWEAMHREHAVSHKAHGHPRCLLSKTSRSAGPTGTPHGGRRQRARGERNGAEGFPITDRERPEVILMDLGLLGIDGCNAACRLTALATLHTMPSMARSAQTLRGDATQALQSGDDASRSTPCEALLLSPHAPGG
jgi:CheY-like chemotaxis protein